MLRDLNMGSIRSIERAFDVLQAFTLEKPQITLEEAAKISKIPRSTVYRILCTLENRGLVQFDPKTLYYRLGLKLIEFGTLIFSTLDVVKEAETALVNLHEQISQTVLMVVKEENEIVYIFKKENKAGLKFSMVVGERRPFTYGALGPVLLAYEPEEQIERILSVPVAQSTPYTVTEKEEYRKRLQKIKEEQVFVQSDETSVGVTGIGAPIFDGREEVIAVIGVVGPTVLMKKDLKLARRLTMETAREISIKMGSQGQGFIS